MRYRVRFTQGAKEDLIKLYEFLLEKNQSAVEQALESIAQSLKFLERFPFSCRKAVPENSFLREMLIPFGNAGYVALFEIENSSTVTILAVRHQREEDYF